MPNVLLSLTTISSVWLLLDILLFLILLPWYLFLFVTFLLLFLLGLLLFLKNTLKLDPLGFLFIDLLDGGAFLLFSSGLLLGLGGLLSLLFILLFLDSLLPLRVLLVELTMLFKIIFDSVERRSVLRVEISLSPHEREHCIIEIVDALSLLDS